MSRHRNVKQLVDEDYYDYDDDDDYYDNDYDCDYDNTNTNNNHRYTTGNNNNNKKVVTTTTGKNNNNNNNNKKGQPSSSTTTTTTTTVNTIKKSGPVTIASILAKGKSNIPTIGSNNNNNNNNNNTVSSLLPPVTQTLQHGTTNSTTGSILLPPPGFSSTSSNSTLLQSPPPPPPPPPGFQSIPTGTATSSNESTLLVKPPCPLFVHPSITTTTTTNPIISTTMDKSSTTTTTAAAASSSSSSSSVIMTIPPILIEHMAQQTRSIPLTIVVLGHVDAGKSTISGHLLYGSDTSQHNGGGIRSKGNNHRNTTTNFAWLLDEDEKERVHGVTMDIATKRLNNTNHTTTGSSSSSSSSNISKSKFDIVLQDAPGHADYVPAMITGTASADAALLCVDATDLHTALGNGQLREHAYLARGLGVNQILVILNKMDVVGWDQEATYLRMEGMLLDFLIQQVGYPASRVRCIPLSGLTGTNLFRMDNTTNNNNNTSSSVVDTETKLLRSWYKGPTLIEALDNFQPPASQQVNKLLEKPLRIIVSDVIESSGSLSLRAKVATGWVKQGETLVVLPVGDNAVIGKFNSLHASTGESSTSSSQTPQQQQLRRQYCTAGELLDCVITGIDAQRISTGSLLVRNQNRPPLTSRCRAKIFVLDNSGNNNSAIQVPLIRGAQMIFHMHHLDVPCHVTVLIRTMKPDGVTTLKERPRALTRNSTAIVELQLSVPICMEAFTDCRALGRFVLRRNGESIAIGRVEETLT